MTPDAKAPPTRPPEGKVTPDGPTSECAPGATGSCAGGAGVTGFAAEDGAGGGTPPLARGGISSEDGVGLATGVCGGAGGVLALVGWVGTSSVHPGTIRSGSLKRRPSGSERWALSRQMVGQRRGVPESLTRDRPQRVPTTHDVAV